MPILGALSPRFLNRTITAFQRDCFKYFLQAGRDQRDLCQSPAMPKGITRRYYVPDDWVTSDIALPAAKEALKRAGRKPEDVDLIILGTTSRPTPR
jgi:hypothetical protein